MSQCTASLVCYQSNLDEVEALLRSVQMDASISACVAVDNGAKDDPTASQKLLSLVKKYGATYVNPGKNIGFGAGHNAALAALRQQPSEFHLMLNPDITFAPTVVPALINVMNENPDVGLIMPRVVYPDQSTQFLCKLLPTPLDFALRRFAPGPLKQLAKRSMDRYELRTLDITQPAEVPFLSGCFMFTRRAALESIAGFNESYFLYMEDVDLCRRLATAYRLMYWPGVSVAHRHERGSHSSFKLTLTHIRSAIRYFNQWGWLFDAERSRINSAAYKRLILDRQRGSLPTEHKSR